LTAGRDTINVFVSMAESSDCKVMPILRIWLSLQVIWAALERLPPPRRAFCFCDRRKERDIINVSPPQAEAQRGKVMPDSSNMAASESVTARARMLSPVAASTPALRPLGRDTINAWVSMAEGPSECGKVMPILLEYGRKVQVTQEPECFVARQATDSLL
jgi:hypothetical protein